MDINVILLPVLSLGGLGLFFGLGLGWAGVMFKVEEDPKIGMIKESLPGVNCGGCGFTGCEQYAIAVAEGNAKANACTVGGAATTQKISDILGIKAEIAERMVAFVKCNGNLDKSTFRYEYFGMNDCFAAMQLTGGGAKSCPHGCLGCGSCVNACAFGALSLVNGIAQVDKEKCIACGKCIPKCPKQIIEFVPYSKTVLVACNSKDAGKLAKSRCTVSCIGCKLCQKACPHEAISVENNLAHVDYSKCTMCGDCGQKCPTGAIIGVEKKEKVEA